MNKDDLLRELGVKPKAPKRDNLRLERGDVGTDYIRPSPSSPTVIKTDEYDFYHGTGLTARSGHHRTPEFNELDDVEAIQTMTDFFAAAFHQQPEVEHTCPNPIRQQFVETLLQTPDYQVLHESTKGNQQLSETAAMEFCHQYSKVLKTVKDCPNQNTKRAKDLTRIASHNAVFRACTNLNKEIDELQEFSIAAGLSSGGDGKLDLEKVREGFNRVKNNGRLRRIFDLAGRYRRAAQAKQRQKVTHGYDDMVGVEPSGDISRLLPLELARLGDEDLELDVMRRIVEGQAMSRQYRGIEKVGKGPIVVCVDESSSMGGEPIANAKALCLAIAWIAKHQNRWCMFYNFCNGKATNTCKLVPGKWDTGELLTWLESFRAGGTSLDVPLRVIPEMWEVNDPPKGKTDQIIITDAQVPLPYGWEAYNDWKKENKVRTISLIIGGAGAGDMALVSDEVHVVGSISVESEAVDSCLSI